MNLKIIQIVGARPQFIKYLPVSKAIQKLRANGGKIEDILIHTGQHYDHAMSKVFFEQLNIPEPSINLGIGSASHGAQTGRMLTRIEDVLLKMKPDRVVVYGDTNSTLAGALAASKLHIPVAHVEAGLRSFNRKMPEEINRVVTDHLSDLLFCPTNISVENLAMEGINKGVHHVGDVMYDALLHYVSKAEKQSDISDKLGLQRSGYLLLTLHRPSNTDSSETLDKIMSAIAQLTHHEFVFPVHPRTRKAILQSKVKFPKNVQVIDPVGYLDILALEKNAAMILTDSGGVQKEAYLQKVPCVTLREETEWKETVEAGWNILVGSDTDRIVHAVRTFKPKSVWYTAFGDGRAAEHITDILTSSFFSS